MLNTNNIKKHNILNRMLTSYAYIYIYIFLIYNLIRDRYRISHTCGLSLLCG